MPIKALQDGEVVNPFDVEKPVMKPLYCLDCEDEMHLVESHRQKNGTFIPRHFRHNPSPDERDCVSGVGGESSIHEKRKYIALSKAIVEFECSEWGIEKQIGERVADAYVKFDGGHHRYGVGLAIEYQHKHKGKEKHAVTQDYFEENYSTIWLWADQFTRNDVDLFAGVVCPIWPDVVPESDVWRDNEYRKQQQRWQEAWESGLSEYSVPATLPEEWFDDKAEEIWRNTDWKDIIRRGCVFATDDSPYQENESSSLVWESEYHLQELRDKWCDESVDIEIDFAPFFSRQFWKSAYSTGMVERKKERKQQRQQKRAKRKKRKEHSKNTSDGVNSNGKKPSKGNAKASSRDIRQHKQRYEGWNQDQAPDGYVKRFDKEQYQWVRMSLAQVPKSIIQKHAN